MTRFGIQRSGTAARPGARSASPRVSPRTHARRHRVLCIAFTLLAGLYAARLVELQVLESGELRQKLEAQSAEWQEIPAARGRILDRAGRPLVAHDTRHQAWVAVNELTVPRAEAIEALDAVLDLSGARAEAVRSARRGWTLAARGVTDEERARLERSVGAGVHFVSHPARAYPRGRVARRLVGTVDQVGAGRDGLELHLDSLVGGEPGRAEMRVDGLGRAYRPPDGEIVEPRPGYDVVLTIDAELQRIAELELGRAMSETGATAGDILLLDPRTGEVLAIASERAGADPGHVPAFSDPYEPGSTLKPFLLASLLEEGLADLDESVDVEGGVLRMGSRTIRDVHGYDTLSVREIIIHSSNVGAAKLSGRLRPSVQHRFLRDFGFGMTTRIDYPAESSGRLTRPDEWSGFSPASHAIGYELSVTSLQLAAAYGALANEGILMTPMLVREIRDAQGRAVRRFEPRAVRRVVSREVARTVSGVLETVVREGTGVLARMARLSVAGKTGTARLAADGGYADGRYRASFVGFAPADDPRVVILTRLEDPAQGSYYGGAIAAPTSQATLQAALATDGVQIDPRLVVSGSRRPWTGRPGGEEARGPFIFAVDGGEQSWSGPARDGTAVTLPDVTGLPPRSAAARLHELGLRVEWLGRERVRGQTPAAGQRLARGEKVVLR